MVLSVTDSIPVPKPGFNIGVRHVIIFMLFLATTVSYATRVSMSIAILAMTTENKYGYQVFDWDQKIKDTILSSFFWGYIILQIPAGMLAGKFGGKNIVLVAMACNGIVNILVPVAADFGGWIAVCVCRVLMGLTQGVLYPSLHGLLGQWSPITERGRMGSIVYAGAQLGTIIELVTGGILADGPWGWPSVYYVAGMMCFTWSALWMLLGASSPSSSRWISKEERKYIETTAGAADLNEKKKMPTPWKSIWTSLPFLSILLAHSGQSLGFWTLLTEIPTYMKEVLNVNLKESALLSALPYIAMFILSFVFSWLADFLVNRNILRLVTVRKIFNTIAFWGPAVALLVLSYLPVGHVTLAVVLLCITVGFNGAHYVGFLISHIDLSPNYASTLMGITNGCGNIFSIMAPLSVSLVVKDVHSAADWRKVFFISIAFYFFSNLFYLIFMTGQIQPWNDQPDTQDSIEAAVNSKKNSTASNKSKADKAEARF